MGTGQKPDAAAGTTSGIDEKERARRAELRRILGAGADSQLGVIEGEEPSGVVRTTQPEEIALAATPGRRTLSAEEREATRSADSSPNASAVHLTDPGVAVAADRAAALEPTGTTTGGRATGGTTAGGTATGGTTTGGTGGT